MVAQRHAMQDQAWNWDPILHDEQGTRQVSMNCQLLFGGMSIRGSRHLERTTRRSERIKLHGTQNQLPQRQATPTLS